MLNITRIGFTAAMASFLMLTGLPRPATAQEAPAQDTNQRRVELVTDLVNSEAFDKYWIGLRCSAVDGALRAQLGLAVGQGLIVDEVFPDSPAKKAGVQQYDVLLKFGDRELAAVTDLVESVQKAEKKEIEVSLIRGGKPQSLKVIPAERTISGTPARIAILDETRANYLQLHGLIEQLRKSGPQGEVVLRKVKPAVVVNKYHQFSTLPLGVSISITKSGDEETKIVVQRGDQKWEATEKTLDKLPEDLQEVVKEFLAARHQGDVHRLPINRAAGSSLQPLHEFSGSTRLFFSPKPIGAASPHVEVVTIPQHRINHPAAPDQLQKQLDEIQKQLEELRKLVEALQSKKE